MKYVFKFDLSSCSTPQVLCMSCPIAIDATKNKIIPITWHTMFCTRKLILTNKIINFLVRNNNKNNKCKKNQNSLSLHLGVLEFLILKQNYYKTLSLNQQKWRKFLIMLDDVNDDDDSERTKVLQQMNK